MRALAVLLVLAAFAAWLWQLRDGAAAGRAHLEQAEGAAAIDAPPVQGATDECPRPGYDTATTAAGSRLEPGRPSPGA